MSVNDTKLDYALRRGRYKICRLPKPSSGGKFQEGGRADKYFEFFNTFIKDILL